MARNTNADMEEELHRLGRKLGDALEELPRRLSGQVNAELQQGVARLQADVMGQLNVGLAATEGRIIAAIRQLLEDASNDGTDLLAGLLEGAQKGNLGAADLLRMTKGGKRG